MNNRAMKDSGIEWMGEIPSHWEVRTIKNVFEKIFTGNSLSDAQKSSYNNPQNAVSYVSTKDLDIDDCSINYNNGIFIPLGDKKFKIAEENSILLCIEGGSAGRKIAITDKSVAFGNKLCSFYSSKNSNNYLFYLLASEAFKQPFYLNMAGLIGGVSVSTIKNIKIPLPPLHEQQAIASYLDDKVSRLNQLIQDQQMVIEEWKAYKQSLITETVTKGLNPEVELKDSGIEWIGEIPNHWEVRKVKYLFRIVGGNGFPEHLQGEVDGDIPFLKVSDINGLNDYVDKGNNYVSISTVKQYRWNVIQENSILMPKIGESLKKNHRKLNRIPCLIDNNTQALVANNLLNHKYFFYQLKCVNMIWFDNSSTIPCVNNKKFRNSSLSYPPLHEQQQIADFLDEKCSKIDRLIEDKQRLIEDLKAYKQSLIYECVTGKKEIV